MDLDWGIEALALENTSEESQNFDNSERIPRSERVRSLRTRRADDSIECEMYEYVNDMLVEAPGLCMLMLRRVTKEAKTLECTAMSLH